MDRPAKMKNDKPIYWVQWIDAAMDAHDGMATIDWLQKNCHLEPCEAVGFLTVADKDRVILSQHRQYDDDDPENFLYRDHLVIPKPNVKRWRRLK